MPIDSDVLGDGENTLIILREQLKKAKAAAATLQGMAKWQRAPRQTAKLGVINPCILRNKPKPQQDILSKLPNEIQHMIWTYLTEQPDKLMLALTCKWHAAAYESLKATPHDTSTKKTTAKKQLSSAVASNSIARKRKSVAITKSQRLAVLYRLGQTMKDEHPFMPKRFRLCYSCVRFIPRSYVVAAKSKGKALGFGWGGQELDVDPSKLKSKDPRLVKSYHCPDCVARERFDAVHLSKEFKDWKKAVGHYGKL